MQRRKANSALRLLPAEDDEDFVLPLGTEEFVLHVVVDAEGEDKLLDVVEEDEEITHPGR